MIKEPVMTSTNEILLYAELSNGALHRNLLELSALGRQLADELGGSVAAVLISGSNAEGLSKDLISCGVDKVYAVEGIALASVQPEVHTLAVAQVCWQLIALNSQLILTPGRCPPCDRFTDPRDLPS
jgi:electron transfer flavoprotein alpha subunit